MPTSILQIYASTKLKEMFPKIPIRENRKPKWLVASNGERLELDFFIPSLSLGIEIQGDQHYRYVKFFHKDLATYNRMMQYEKEKAEICKKRAVTLIKVHNKREVDAMIEDIRLMGVFAPYESKSKRAQKRHRKNRKGFITFYKSQNGNIRIWFTRDLGKEYRSFNYNYGSFFERIHYVYSENIQDDLKRLFSLFENKRLNLHWFALDEKDIEFIKNLTSPEGESDG